MTISTAISQTTKPAANTDTVLFGPVPAGLRASLTVSGVNQSTSSTSKVFIAVSQNSDPSSPGPDWIEYGREIASNGGGLERTCKFLKPGDQIVVRSNDGAIAFRVDGLQEDNV